MAEVFGRKLEGGPTDLSAEARIPTQRLRLIPKAARRSFVPYLAQPPGLKAGENDLTRIAPGRPRASGTAIGVTGRATDTYGRPLRNTLIEIWNANQWGRYTHVDDPADQPLDPHFLGLGRTLTDDDGRYGFTTIRPGAYLARADIGRWRPAHVHLSIRGGGARLITQMYFPGDPHFERDPMVIVLGDDAPRHIGQPIAPETPEVTKADRFDPEVAEAYRFDPEVAEAYRFDIVVGGPNTSWFEQP